MRNGSRITQPRVALRSPTGAVGSGSGIDAITGRTVDFGASDAPLTSDQAKACKQCVQVPWALAGQVPAYHLFGCSRPTETDGEVLAKIYLGEITTWNDPAIKALNPGVNIPSTHITPVYRSDGSGDSYVWSNYLSSVDPQFKSKVGLQANLPFQSAPVQTRVLESPPPCKARTVRSGTS